MHFNGHLREFQVFSACTTTKKERKSVVRKERTIANYMLASSAGSLAKSLLGRLSWSGYPKPAIIECNADVDEIVVGEEVAVEISLTLARRKGLAE